MIEFDESEYLSSTVEDSELIAVLSFYAHLPAVEAIAEKDKLLYGGDLYYRVSGGSAPLLQRGADLEQRTGNRTGSHEATRGTA